MKLNEIREHRGARHRRVRVGRGIGSGKGKTAGKGTKGQKARAGVSLQGFEGGQMPLHRRLPKRGFTNIFRKRFAVINLGTLQKAIETGRIDAAQPVDEAILRAAGLVKKRCDGVRLLAKGQLAAKLSLTVTGASKAAVTAVEGAGGQVTVTAPPVTEAPAAGKAAKGKRAKSKAKLDEGESGPTQGRAEADRGKGKNRGAGQDGAEPTTE